MNTLEKPFDFNLKAISFFKVIIEKTADTNATLHVMSAQIVLGSSDTCKHLLYT